MHRKAPQIIKPSALKAGSTAALFAPAFAFKPELHAAGRATLESVFGLKTVQLDTLFARDGYFSGSDDRRLDELYHWLTDDQTDALIAVRGGYGCSRIYPELIARLKKAGNLKPKIVHGYSDLTILLNGLHQDLGWITFHGPVVVSKIFSGKDRTQVPALDDRTFRQSLFSIAPLSPVTHEGTVTLNEGQAKGRLAGGCLSLLCSSIGTPYEIDTKDKILFIEDVGERPYRVDRMLTQLIHAGKLDSVKGIVFGQFADCRPPSVEEFGSATPEIRQAIEGAIKPLLKKVNIPVIYDFPAGHGSPQCTLPIGVEVELRATASQPSLHFLESACS